MPLPADAVIKKEEAIAEDRVAIRYLTPQTAVFSSTDGGFAALTFEDKTYRRVDFYLAFPFTDPEGWISVRESEENGREIGLIEDLSIFDDATKTLIKSQLSLRYFTPVILKVREIKEEFGYSYWNVLTDRGDCRFTCDQNGVAKLSDTRLLISDVDGNRFEIPSVEALTPKELRMVDLYL